MAARASGKTKPVAIDLDAIAADDEPFHFRFDGKLWELPGDPDIRAMGLLAQNDVLGCMSMLLGDDQAEKMSNTSANLSTKRFEALLESYFASNGMDLGKALRSTKS